MDSENVKKMVGDASLQGLTRQFLEKTIEHRYSYNFLWMGRPIIQYPQDMVAMQEIIWRVRPDLIIETGVAHGGSLVYYASLLELIGGEGMVLGIDIDIRQHNRVAIESHPMAPRIKMVEGSSVDPLIVTEVARAARQARTVLVALDSNHTHEHVLKELESYSPFVTEGSYMVVFDTMVEDVPKALYPDRPWGPGDNPKTAVLEFLEGNDRFVIDTQIQEKLLISVAPSGYLRCLRS